MRVTSKLLATSAIITAGLALASAANAVTLAPFASYSQQGTLTTIAWKMGPGLKDGKIFSTAPAGSTAATTSFVTFNFQDTSKYLDHLDAALTLNGSEVGTAALSGPEQDQIAGTFSFIYEGVKIGGVNVPLVLTDASGHTYTPGSTNLLTAVYTLAKISGSGSSGGFHGSTDIGTVKFSSDIITNLPTALASDFSYSLVSIAPPLGFASGDALNSFKAGASGTFSAGFVPEPATWAMMITGLGLLGLAARRRRAMAFA
jgi:hypothetical protein